MDLVMKIAMLSCLLLAVCYVDAEVACSTAVTVNISVQLILPQKFEVNISCEVNATRLLCENSGGVIESDDTCIEIEPALLNSTDGMFNCTQSGNCENNNSTTCWSLVDLLNFICSDITPTGIVTPAPIPECTDNNNCTNPTCSPSCVQNVLTAPSSTISVATIQPTTNSTITSHNQSMTIATVGTEFPDPASTTVDLTSTTVVSGISSSTRVSTTDHQTTMLNTTSPPIIEMPTNALTAAPNNSGSTLEITTTTILWIVLGCLIALIVVVLCAIILVCIAHCRRYKRKKQPTALDIISKWEDTPNESSEIQLLSMKTTEEGDDKADGEDKIDDGVADPEKEEGKVGSDEKSDKVEVKESKEDDVTVGTFGFAEKPIAVEAKAESPTGSEKKEGQSEKGEATKEGENEKLVEVTIEKAGEESAVDIGSSGGNSAPNNTSVTGTTTTVPTEKEKAQEGTRPEPVPVQIPIIGGQVTDIKAPAVEHAVDSEVKTSDTEQSNKPASPSKVQEEKSETSPSNQDNVLATKSVSKEPEPAATITKPQTETVSLASDKPPSISISADDAFGGLSLFTNEDMEKALGVAATKDLGQVESTQL